MENVRDERECSFCRDSGWECDDCKIDHNICNMDDDTDLYTKIWRCEVALIDAVNAMVDKLTEKYEAL